MSGQLQLHRAALVVLAAALAALMLAFGPVPAAQADRCQPTELVGIEPPIPEDQDPVCAIVLSEVYPRLGCDNTTLRQCLMTLNARDTIYRNDVCLSPPDFAGGCPYWLSDLVVDGELPGWVRP